MASQSQILFGMLCGRMTTPAEHNSNPAEPESLLQCG